jgi:DNA topoisomerase-1
VKEFWDPFISLINQKEKEVQKSDVTTEKTEESCPECKKPLVIKLGKYGRFYACSGFPECRVVRSLNNDNDEETPDVQVTDEKCDSCGSPLVLRQGRYGKFLGCSKYPDCTFIRSLNKPVTLDISCPECSGGNVVEKKTRRGKIFYGCANYPKCEFASWDKPIGEPCPDCGSAYLIEKNSKRYGKSIKCPSKSCKYKRKVAAEEEQEG